MYPLIEIKTVPIEIEMKTTHAKLEYTRATAEMEIRRDQGGLSIKSRPIRLNLDTFEARNSVFPTPARSVEQSAEGGRKAAYEATATYARQGKLLVNARIGEELVTRFAEEAANPEPAELGLQFLPKGGVKITWDQGEMNIRYEMDKLNFDWRMGKGDFKFTPGDIEISVTQMPDVIIKYVGGPLYVPPSADPNYEPVDEKSLMGGRELYLDTKYFGQISYEEGDILSFEDGIFGFIEEKRFLLLPFAGSEGALLCLQSVQTPELAFVVMDPFALKPDYAPVLSPEELGAMGVEWSQELCFYVMCVVREPVAESTVNLKCPVVVNSDTRRAAQVILETGEYQMRHRLSEFGPKEGGAC